MNDDEKQIRELIERWARAVHEGDLDRVLADHSEDIVMFDVPPPHDGVRGRDAYRETWPGFFEYQRQGASFEIVSLEVTAGVDVAFAHALLRCGTAEDFARDPAQRLRLTIGLRKENGRWVVSHEHHSFADRTFEGEGEVRALHRRWFEATAAKDLDGIMAGIADDVVSYEHEVPLAYVGADAVREVCRQGLEASDETVTWDVPDLTVLVGGDLAVGWGLNRMGVPRPDGSVVVSWSRGTRVFRRGRDGWEMVHQQVSYPFDPETGRAATDLEP
jgi:uncharacterized protein (TIGR02246 family)